MDVIHEEGDFECNTGMDGTEIVIRRAAVCSTEEKADRRGQSCSSRVGRLDESLNKNTTACFVTCRILRRWKKHVLAEEETCCVIFSLQSRRTLRSRITIIHITYYTCGFRKSF